MRLTITIDCDGAAFEPAPFSEAREILGSLWQRYSAEDLRAYLGDPTGLPLADSNGNTVGRLTLTDQGGE